jgi:tRNA wybutosine-synthesizing protein 2
MQGNCARKTPVSIADRVIMGYVGRTSQFLEYGIRALKPGGVLHYHDSVPIHLMPSSLMDRIESEAKSQGRGVEILEWHRVKKYSPGVWHFVVDTRIR